MGGRRVTQGEPKRQHGSTNYNVFLVLVFVLVLVIHQLAVNRPNKQQSFLQFMHSYSSSWATTSTFSSLRNLTTFQDSQQPESTDKNSTLLMPALPVGSNEQEQDQRRNDNVGDASSSSLPSLEQVANSIAVTYRDWPHDDKYGWCLLSDSKERSHDGFLFAKTFKTGSSTAVGVHLNVARRVAERLQQQTGGLDALVNNNNNTTIFCNAHYEHAYSLDNVQRQRTKSRSFLWTIIRNPATRSVSAYYFYQVGHKRRSALNTKAMFSDLKRSKNKMTIQLRQDRKISDLSDKDNLQRKSTSDVANQVIAPHILQEYNFIALMERWEESMAVLQLLLQLEDKDLIVLSSKASGGWSRDWGKPKSCFAIPPKALSAKVKEYLQTNFTRNNHDYLLYLAANKSLDLTIARLGVDRVQQVAKRLKTLQDLANQQCQHRAYFPCSSNGTWQDESNDDCYYKDMGCGYKCVEEVLPGQ